MLKEGHKSGGGTGTGITLGTGQNVSGGNTGVAGGHTGGKVCTLTDQRTSTVGSGAYNRLHHVMHSIVTCSTDPLK